MYPTGSMSSNSSSSNCSNSTNSTNNSSGSSHSANSNVNSAANSTKISPSSSGITTPTRISIKEANDHLQLLHSRVSELEEIIRQQSDQSAEQEEIYRRQLKELKSAKEVQIDELTKTIVRLEEKVKDLETSIKMKNEKLEENQTRLALVDQLVDYIPGLDQLIVALRRIASLDDNVIETIHSKGCISLNSSLGGFLNQDVINSTNNSDTIINGNINNKENLNHSRDVDYRNVGINVDMSNENPSLIDMACQTDLTGVTCVNPVIANGTVGRAIIDNNNNNSLILTSGISGVCSSEPCYSKRSSIDETNCKEKASSDERVVGLSVSGDAVGKSTHQQDTHWHSERQQVKSTRSNRPRRVRKSSSAANCQYLASQNWEKDFYCGTSLNNPMFGPGRTIGYKIHSNSSSSSHISGKIEKSFSITSNFSEDEDFPISGPRGYQK